MKTREEMVTAVAEAYSITTEAIPYDPFNPMKDVTRCQAVAMREVLRVLLSQEPRLARASSAVVSDVSLAHASYGPVTS